MPVRAAAWVAERLQHNTTSLKWSNKFNYGEIVENGSGTSVNHELVRNGDMLHYVSNPDPVPSAAEGSFGVLERRQQS